MQKGFWWLFGVQKSGASNDNIIKNAIAVGVTFGVLTPILDPKIIVTIAAGLFIFPFFTSSAAAGQITDRYEKTSVIRATKLFEIFVMALGSYGFIADDIYCLLGALFFMGMQSTLFGPAKYSTIPELVDEDNLIKANGYIELGTFLAIMIGTIIGGALIVVNVYAVCAVLMTVAFAGYWMARQMEPVSDKPNLRMTKALWTDIDWNPFKTFGPMMAIARENKTVYYYIMANSWFWFFGAMVMTYIPEFANSMLWGQPVVANILLAGFSLGIGVGSILCGKISKKDAATGLIPIGAIGLSIFLIDLAWSGAFAWQSIDAFGNPQARVTFVEFFMNSTNWRIMFDLVMLAVFGGLYVVPLYAGMQQKSDRAKLSQVIAAGNIISAGFMVLAAVMGGALLAFNVTIPQIYVITAVLNIAFHRYYLLKREPEFLRRLGKWLNRKIKGEIKANA